MTDNTSTPYSSQVSILADLWLNYRNDEEFIDFIEYNDLGLPLAYAIANDIVKSTDTAQNFVAETFDLLLAGLEIDEDTGFETLDDLLSEAQ
jgi:hypothetical protein